MQALLGQAGRSKRKPQVIPSMRCGRRSFVYTGQPRSSSKRPQHFGRSLHAPHRRRQRFLPEEKPGATRLPSVGSRQYFGFHLRAKGLDPRRWPSVLLYAQLTENPAPSVPTQGGSKQCPLIPKRGAQLHELAAHPVASSTVNKAPMRPASSLMASPTEEMSTKETHVDMDTCCGQRARALVTQLQAARDECTAMKTALHQAVAAQAAIVAASWIAQRNLRDEMQRRLLTDRRREAEVATKHAQELQALRRELNQVAGELEGALANHAASVVAYNELFASTVAGNKIEVAFLEAQIEGAASAIALHL
ncbi:hypothetical protein SPRG_16255 [Saprolegnia parasitica CBS 223.65]|uniref:Uncharacterized protein n=1 Tax=Saprolegnia parasitica (strain CBS 223.65) TaxID=695850 RepID=A0A067BUU3_SAPPC|nr:hypothetical protein SPRG_16255 [Saprolegnia parasitica CBS 223.65]KDO18392.1 hypothetical protein SPRG_16255 [Saprolegnia parasitica CBS 223.65]|eukprot:XP_012210903.1 hypothetical protein SPRG_16255 [Saprolegnia parasitica CBS 223.65]